jgi:hypothetical protein
MYDMYFDGQMYDISCDVGIVRTSSVFVLFASDVIYVQETK